MDNRNVLRGRTGVGFPCVNGGFVCVGVQFFVLSNSLSYGRGFGPDLQFKRNYE